MSLSHKAAQAISLLPCSTEERATLRVEDNGQILECELLAVDRLACSMESLSVKGPQLQAADLDGLQAIASQVADRLTYLLEAVSTLEVDAQGCVVQLRSQPPGRAGEQISYYELLVRTGEITLGRFQAHKGRPGRQRVAFQVTQEVFQRIVHDLSTVG